MNATLDKPRRFFRPRSLFLTALMLVAALVIWRQGKQHNDATRLAVQNWVQEAIRRAASDRDVPLAMGATEPIAAEAFAAWVRDAAPPSIASDASIEIVPLGQHFLNDDGSATHRVQVLLHGHRATLELRWDATALSGTVVLVDTAPTPMDAPAAER